MRVGFTGSRAWFDPRPVDGVLHRLDPAGVTVVVGDARGLDRIVAVRARRLDFDVEVHHADWERFPRAAGPIRNQEMVDSGLDVVYAFPLGSSRGTWDMVTRCRRAGVRVAVIHHRLEDSGL